MKKRHRLAFEAYVEGSRQRHYRSALLLSGNHHDAEDLVQDAMTKLFLRWPQISRHGQPGAYVTKIMTNRLIDGKRSAWSRHETQRPDLPERPMRTAHADEVVESDAMLALLRVLPATHRVALVAKYYHDMTTPQLAQLLGRSERQVNRYLSEGLALLRELAPEVNADD